MSDFDRFASDCHERHDAQLRPFGARPRELVEARAEILVSLARRHVGLPERLRVLDLGCGTGLLARLLADPFADVVGADVSEALVEHARSEPSAATFVTLTEGARLPFRDGEFHLVVCACVLHHVAPDHRSGMLQEAARVLQPGGAVVVFEHNPWNPLTRMLVATCDFDHDAELLTRGDVGRLMEGAGLLPVESRFITFFPGFLAPLRPVEPLLGWCPLGGQHLVVGRRPLPAEPRPEWRMVPLAAEPPPVPLRSAESYSMVSPEA